MKAKIVAGEVQKAQKAAIAAGLAFCSVCGGLFTLDNGELPQHTAVGRGSTTCQGGKPTHEGEVSP